jgi:hypothetical protein
MPERGGGYRVLAEENITGTLLYLYGRECLGQYDDEWLPLAVPRSRSGGCALLGVLARYYLDDATGYVRLPSPLRFAGRTEGTDDQGTVVSAWLFDPDGFVLEGPQGPVSHLIPRCARDDVCRGIYDWSTGLIYRDRRYFDPMLGIWLALAPLVVLQSWRGRKKRRWWTPWYVVLFCVVSVGGMLVGCTGTPTGTEAGETACVDTVEPELGPDEPEPTGTPEPDPTQTQDPTVTTTPTQAPTNTPSHQDPVAPLPPSYAQVDIRFRKGGSTMGVRSPAVAIETNAFLSHHHFTGAGFTTADVESVEIFDVSGNSIHFASAAAGEVAVAADAETGHGWTLIVLKSVVWANQSTALLGDADTLREGDDLLQSVTLGASPGLYPTKVVTRILFPQDYHTGIKYRAFKVSPDRTVSGDSGCPIYGVDGLTVYGVNSSGEGNYGAIESVSFVRDLIRKKTRALRESR